jgi:hypothetical protein
MIKAIEESYIKRGGESKTLPIPFEPGIDSEKIRKVIKYRSVILKLKVMMCLKLNMV